MACSALGTGSSCGSPGEGTCVITWHVNQHCMGTIRTDQIPEPTKQTGEVVIRERPRVWSTYLVVAWFGVRLPADSHQTSRSVISQRDRCSLHWPSLVKYKCLGHTRCVDFWNTWQNTVWFRFFFFTSMHRRASYITSLLKSHGSLRFCSTDFSDLWWKYEEHSADFFKL